MGEIPFASRALPRTPAGLPVFSSSPGILVPGSRQIGLIQNLAGWLAICTGLSGRRTRTSDAFSWPPKPASSDSRSLGTPHCDTGSGRLSIDRASLQLLPPTKETDCTPQRPDTRPQNGDLAVSPAHQPGHWPSGQNSIQFTRMHSNKPHDSTTLVCEVILG